MSISSSRLLISTSLLAAATAFAAPAWAQVAEPVEGSDVETSADVAAPDEDEGDIVITGSRIARPDLEVSSPVNVVSQQEIQDRQPNTAEDLLRELPSVRPNLGPAVNNGSNGAANVDLRGIGANRTLVLLDGRRLVPFGLDGTVDLNVIPVGLVERVDVVTGGASSVYGADAVAGVVNFVTRRNFTGLDVQANYRIAERGDAAQFRADALLGANFADDRGNVVLGLGYSKRDPLLVTARDIAAFPISSTTGLFAGSQASVPVFITSPNNTQLGLPNLGFGAVYDPTLGKLRAATAADTYNTNINTYFVTPLERYSVYGAGRYEVAPGIEAYMQGMFTRNDARIQLASSATFTNTYQLSLNNPYLPAAVRSQLCAGRSISVANCNAAAAVVGGPGTPGYVEIPVIAQRRFTEYGPRGNPIESQMFQTIVGVRGDITKDLHFDLSAQYGETSQHQTRENWGSFSKVQQSLRAFRNAQGQLVCADPANGCVPLNLFGPEGSITPAMLNFIDLDAQINRLVKQTVVNGSVNGDLFGIQSPLADSAIGFALGAEYRKISAAANPDAPSQIQGEVLGTGARTPPDFGQYDVKEAFGEIIIPLITDRFIHSATLEGGIRFSDYSTTGKSTTWKAGGTLEPIDGIRFRGMYQVAVRSPNIQELFQSPVQGLSNLTIDPCQGAAPSASKVLCEATGAPAGSYGSIPTPSSGQINVTTSGNPNLDVEKAKTATIGAVFQPSFIPRLAVTLDWWRIRVTDAISSPSQNDILNGCYSTTLNPSQTPNAFCELIQRNPLNGSLNGAGETKGVILASSNLGRIATAGWDLGITYKIDLGDFIGGTPGSLRLGFNGTRLNYYHFQATPISINRDCTAYYSTSCTNPRPRYKWNARASWDMGAVETTLLWNHISAVNYEPIAPVPAPPLSQAQPGSTAAAFNGLCPNTSGPNGTNTCAAGLNFKSIPAFDYFDLGVRFDVSEDFEMGLLVENLFDKKPPLVGSGVGGTAFNNGNTFPTVYDAIGRTFTVSGRLKF
ncbi:MAG TPA: TonB-dependent receptor [Allosphingosinicella sp.]|nr:TonB-dependent receptor [Allosphingosinicella sp.]